MLRHTRRRHHSHHQQWKTITMEICVNKTLNIKISKPFLQTLSIVYF